MKKLIVLAIAACASVAAMAVEPFVQVNRQPWGGRYGILTDVNGFTYRISLPTGSSKIKVNTRTGWYVINSYGVITSYSDEGLK